MLQHIKPLKLRPFGSKSVYKNSKVIGFPGEIEKKGQLYGMSGDYNVNDKGTLISYKQIDTSRGQSGSPIFCHSENKYDDDDDIFIRFDEIIGVHTGGSLARGKNWGTAFNDEKLKWIADVLQYAP